jgi:hypothetical protein
MLNSEEDMVDSFSKEDRRELITQGVKLDQVIKELEALRTDTVLTHEKRLVLLERSRDNMTTQIKTILWIGGFLITIVQIGLEIFLHATFK